MSEDTELTEALHTAQRPATDEDITAWVAALDALSGDDPEHAHGEADRVLLQAVPPEVRAAYERVTSRCSWWAHG